MIRADENYINNQQNWLTPICRIDILNYEGNLIKRVVLNARNFLDSNLIYHGEYKEEFRYFLGDSTLIFPQTQARNFNPNDGVWAFNSRGSNPTDGSNKMDIQVYWYGNCDMWIDYVRVDNDVADNLLTTDTTNQIHQIYLQWLQWEATLANYNSSPLKFYIEEFEFNHIPCMSYVSRKLKDYSGNPNLSLMSVVNLTQYVLHLPYDYVINKRVSAAHILRYLIDSVGESQVFSEPYSLTGKIPNTSFNESYVPNTLPVSDYNLSEGRLGEPVSPAVYDSWLQNHLDAADLNLHTKHGYFSWYLKTMDTMSKARDIPHINMPQAHLWYTPEEEALKEPTNEELEMTTVVPITYGARGSIYFMYGNWGTIGSGNSYGRGLTNPKGTTPFFEPRDSNVYGQLKWEKVKSINQKLKTWGPILLSFNNADRHSYIYRLERTDCLSETYFSDIVTYYPTTSPIYNCLEDAPDEIPPQNWQYDCKALRYLQVAVFKEYSPNKRTYPYFMIVNRRCSPYLSTSTLDSNGGYRKIKVKFDINHNELGGFNEWVIKDVADDRWEQSFNKTQSLYVDLGEFMPGEGRLYHLIPKAQTGGVLLGDEYITSGEEFTCEDTVWTDGYDLTIENGVNISFSDSAKFVVEGGTFQMGNAQHSGPNTINMTLHQTYL